MNPSADTPPGVVVPAGRLSARLHPDLQLRSSGFPAARLLPRPGPQAAAATHAVRAAEQDLTARQDAFRERVFPALKEAFPGLERAQRTAVVRSSRIVAHGRPLPEGTAALFATLGHAPWARGWEESVGRLADTVRAAQHSYLETVEEVYSQVRTRVAEPRVHQAIAQSSGGFAERLFRPDGPVLDPRRLRGKDRGDLMTAHRYLRRFAARCETVSYFGPSCFAALDPAAPDAVSYGPPRPERTSVDASAWLLRDLAARHAPRGGDQQVSRDPLWRRESDALVRTADGRTLALSPDAVRLWDALGGDWTTLRELARTAGLQAAGLRAALPSLTPALRRGPLVPSTERHALRALAAALPEAPAVHTLLQRLEETADAPWPEREKILAGADAELTAAGLDTRRNAGEHYGDRSFWHEERSGPHSEGVRFGAPTVDALTRAVGPLLEPLYLAALLSRADARAEVRRAFGGRPVPLARAATADLPGDRPRYEALRAALIALVRATPAGPDGAVRLTSQQVDAVCAPFWATLTAPDTIPSAALPGLDLLAAGPSPAEAVWVLGEVHDDSSSIVGGSSTRVHCDPEGLYADFCAAVARLADPHTMAGVVSRRRSMHITPELPGLAIELSGLSTKPRTSVVPVADVTVSADGSAVDTAAGRRWLYPGDLASTLHRAVALPAVVPIDLTGPDGSPRVLIDGVVVERASWKLPAPGASGPGYPHWSAWQRLRAERGLPRRVFVRHQAETKPVFVDLDDPVAVDDLARLGPGELRLSECLPGPDDLWWNPDGGHQVAELRIACLIDHTTAEGAAS
ncbi:hypothetical protein ACWGF3_09000 [Streptomyces xanthophaeus]